MWRKRKIHLRLNKERKRMDKERISYYITWKLFKWNHLILSISFSFFLSNFCVFLCFDSSMCTPVLSVIWLCSYSRLTLIKSWLPGNVLCGCQSFSALFFFSLFFFLGSLFWKCDMSSGDTIQINKIEFPHMRTITAEEKNVINCDGIKPTRKDDEYGKLLQRDRKSDKKK